VKEAEKFLGEQWPKQPPISMSQAEMNAAVIKALKRVKPPTVPNVEEVYRHIWQQSAIVDELNHWLDKQLKN
jgi:hypothetical protein